MDNDTQQPAKKKQITSLELLWAIRDIPSSILNTTQKGILAMFVACVGIHHKTRWPMKQLEEKLGGKERTLRGHFHYLESIKFLNVSRPKNYKKGETNGYSLNKEEIIIIASMNKK